MDIGKQRRDRYTKQVLERAGEDWRVNAMNCILENWKGREGTGEDFRISCQREGIRPHHPNAWGALILHLKRLNILVATGEYRSPKLPKSHARKVQVYRVRGGKV